MNIKFNLDRINNQLIPEIIEYTDNVNNNQLPKIVDTDDNNDIIPVQQGQGLNNIKIDENALNKNILKIRYLNGRKLNNQLIKYDYKISKDMKKAKNLIKIFINYLLMKKIFIMN